ncbi:MAG: hypothetical protein ACYTFW_05100 [Planctomycetota bacterium]|jgi:hypothetical protein
MELIELRETCQRTLNDAAGATFTDELVDGWIAESIQEYSQHFGKTVSISVTGIAAATYAYTITDPIGNIIKVEYPLSNDPPSYLRKRVYASDDFWLNGDSYDYLQTKGDGAGILYLSDPSQSTTATITAMRSFDETATTVEVPARHEPILIARIRWSARQFEADGEMLSPTSNSSLLMAQMEQNARSARNNYFKLLFNALLAETGESEVVVWQMDKYDRVY